MTELTAAKINPGSDDIIIYYIILPILFAATGHRVEKIIIRDVKFTFVPMTFIIHNIDARIEFLYK